MVKKQKMVLLLQPPNKNKLIIKKAQTEKFGLF